MGIAISSGSLHTALCFTKMAMDAFDKHVSLTVAPFRYERDASIRAKGDNALEAFEAFQNEEMPEISYAL
ncbi:unnamed protein product [Prunus brigantina]